MVLPQSHGVVVQKSHGILSDWWTKQSHGRKSAELHWIMFLGKLILLLHCLKTVEEIKKTVVKLGQVRMFLSFLVLDINSLFGLVGHSAGIEFSYSYQHL